MAERFSMPLPLPPPCDRAFEHGASEARGDAPSATVELPVGETGDLGATAHLTEGLERGPGETLAPGTLVGAYLVHDAIARGGFGTVYRATRAASGEPRALKVLHAELAGTREARLRFEHEVASIRRVSHPNVIVIEDVGKLDDGQPYFAMELLAGVDLGAYLDRVGRLSLGEALAILAPLAAALDAVHAAGIVHRDLKPSNVFLAEEGGRRRVVLLDFSIAKMMGDRGPGLTASRRVVGTPAFMAPEQVQGRLADERTDVYALGALAYCMLTGRTPFMATRDLLPQLVIHATPPRPSALAPLHPTLDEILLGALAKEPSRRPASAGALFAALARTRADDDEGSSPERASSASSALMAKAASSRRAAAIYVEVRADDEAPGDEACLHEDFDAILPRVSGALAARGLRRALEMGNTALFTAPLPAGGEAEEEARSALLRAALALEGELARRPGRDARVEVSLILHAGPFVEASTEGAPGGPLLEIDVWVPDSFARGVRATRAMLAGLALDADPTLSGLAGEIDLEAG